MSWQPAAPTSRPAAGAFASSVPRWCATRPGHWCPGPLRRPPYDWWTSMRSCCSSARTPVPDRSPAVLRRLRLLELGGGNLADRRVRVKRGEREAAAGCVVVRQRLPRPDDGRRHPEGLRARDPGDALARGADRRGPRCGRRRSRACVYSRPSSVIVPASRTACRGGTHDVLRSRVRRGPSTDRALRACRAAARRSCGRRERPAPPACRRPSRRRGPDLQLPGADSTGTRRRGPRRADAVAPERSARRSRPVAGR